MRRILYDIQWKSRLSDSLFLCTGKLLILKNNVLLVTCKSSISREIINKFFLYRVVEIFDISDTSVAAIQCITAYVFAWQASSAA